MIQNQFKRFASLSEVDCMFMFLEMVHPVVKYDQETFKCALGVSLHSVQLLNVTFFMFYLFLSSNFLFDITVFASL